MPVAVIGIYPDRSGIERVEIHPDMDAAKLAIERWRIQRYSGIVEAWEQRPSGAAEQVVRDA